MDNGWEHEKKDNGFYTDSRVHPAINTTHRALARTSCFDKDHRNTFRSETVLLRESETQGMTLLPDLVKITELEINNALLDQIYKQAHNQAIARYYDAKLSIFSIQAFPFSSSPEVIIYLTFYSKFVDKRARFRFSSYKPKVVHSPPDRLIENERYRCAFTTLPWHKSPNWMQFLKRSYMRVGPFPNAIGTSYDLFADPPERGYPSWRLQLYNGFNEQRYRFIWTGGKIDDDNVKQIM